MPRVRLCPSMQREKNISDILKKGLIDKGWSNKHLAKLLNMDAGNVSRILNHPMSVRLDTICRVAAKLGITELNIK